MIELTPVAHVESALADRASAPKQGDEGGPDAWLVFEPAVLPALQDILRIRVGPLEAVDGTPVVDVKPVLRRR